MLQGQVLKNFIDNQPKSKISIAKDLGMSKQNLFTLFTSRELSEETKKKFENYFGKKIFDQSTLTNGQVKAVKPEPTPSLQDALVRAVYSMADSIETNKILAKLVEENQKIILQNLEANKENLADLKKDVAGVAEMQDSYHEFWAKYAPPKGLTSKQVIDTIRNTAFLRLEKKQGK